MPSILRIPIPGTNGLAVELTPRRWTPKGGTTSSLFIQSSNGKRMLRLDYGFNKTTNTFNFHWNIGLLLEIQELTGYVDVPALLSLP